MSWKDLKISRKLYIGYGIVFLATAIVGYVGFNGLTTMRATSSRTLEVSRLTELSLELR